MRALLGLALLATACRGRTIPEGTPADVAEQVRFCAQMDRGVEDWCVFEALHGGKAIPGESFYGLCRGMADSDARDACFELFSRLEESREVPELCAQIQQQRLRESCFLTIAERVMRSSGPIQDSVVACQKAGSLEDHCLSHLPAQRQTVWMQSGGLPAMATELQTLLQINPAAAGYHGLGFSAGNAALQLGGTNGAGVCSVFGDSTAGRSCSEIFYAGGAGSFSAPGTPAWRPAP